jgi:hypothetical protein
MNKSELLGNVDKMHIGDPELPEWIADLKPGPKRDGNYPSNCNRGCGANRYGPKLRTGRPCVQRTRFEPTQCHCTHKIRVGNDPPVRVAIASPVAKPAQIVADQVGTTCRAI